MSDRKLIIAFVIVCASLGAIAFALPDGKIEDFTVDVQIRGGDTLSYDYRSYEDDGHYSVYITDGVTIGKIGNVSTKADRDSLAATDARMRAEEEIAHD